MTDRTAGIHHITAFSRDPQATVDFYTGVLGLRLVKQTVNFDATDTYHLYFGDEAGSPGTVITFFPSARARVGQVGGGQVGVTTFVVPPGTAGYWEERLSDRGVATEREARFGETYVRFANAEGLRMELIEREEGAERSAAYAGIPAGRGIKGFGGAVLFSRDHARTAAVLETILGLDKTDENGEYARYRSSSAIGGVIDLPLSNLEWGKGGVGTVHHIAFRAPDEGALALWRERIIGFGLKPTEIKDRQYFKAVYVRDEGGILFEIATDPPGFARDEPSGELGRKLMLPAWFEPNRAELERGLPPIAVRATADADGLG
ncbi:glyoxalase family protein [Paenibacillus sp. UNC496MF]|uniref:ring-cleaving dioxygenase n=1 Tax=Paenibacillus sp. UNC496MF TaxID=1502753 RepID=UPI0008F44878|nr:ring-cleaving dioxygenase [Paenibacillus sp. UNC496MF]SFI36847.1 glyoxalase family protein [Paenibacillus sp. UNC496MF]